MERIHTKEDLILILSYMKAKRIINSQSYRSLRSTTEINLARFLRNMGMIRKIIE